MLNLFDYGASDSDKEEEKATQPIENEPKSLFASVPKAKKSKKRLVDIAKFAKVSVDELKQAFDEEEKSVTAKAAPNPSLLSAAHRVEDPEDAKDSKDSKEEEKPEPVSSLDDQKEKGMTTKKEGIIPLNPFMDDVEIITKQRNEDIETPEINYFNRIQLESHDNPEREEDPTTPSGYGYSYGSNYSAKQYEAFMKRSGMLATANAATSNTDALLGENAKYMDKVAKKALEEGNLVDLDQRDVHNPFQQPSTEYWQQKRKRERVAEEFGKYAHIAPTQVQKTRNQINYLATQAINELAERDGKLAEMRKTKKEIRAKYGW